MKVLLTGADGFVGNMLINYLQRDGHQINAAVRYSSGKKIPDDTGSVKWFNLDLDSEDNDYQRLLNGIDIVLHLASRVHITNKRSDAPGYYRLTNIDGVRMLAERAVDFGVKRFIYLSTIKVNGEFTEQYDKFKEDDPLNPCDTYALSKCEAERILRDICSRSNMESVILRPPLIYGPGVKANFLQLLKFIDKGLPLPFGRINNSRSFIYLGNLCDCIRICMFHEHAANQLFLVSDYDFSTPELIQCIAERMGRNAYLISCPVLMLKTLGMISGLKSSIDKLTQSLLVDSSKVRNLLGWIPPFSSGEGLQATVDWYMKSNI